MYFAAALMFSSLSVFIIFLSLDSAGNNDNWLKIKTQFYASPYWFHNNLYLSKYLLKIFITNLLFNTDETCFVDALFKIVKDHIQSNHNCLFDDIFSSLKAFIYSYLWPIFLSTYFLNVIYIYIYLFKYKIKYDI